MNLKITKSDHEYLQKYVTDRYIIGSRMYGTHTENSDTDYLCIFEHPITVKHPYYEPIHQLHYDDIADNAQYIYTTPSQFFRNLNSGDSTINADVVMFTDFIKNVDEISPMVMNYKVIKAFLGFAKRDLKQGGKLHHVKRSLHCAEKLLNYELPKISEFTQVKSEEELQEKQIELRTMANQMLDSGELPLRYVPHIGNPIMRKWYKSSNMREFKY